MGVTGGIGSGKSTVCAEFTRIGRTVLSADQIARELMETDQVVRHRLKSAFGERAFTPDGTVDRQGLASLVFSSSSLLKKLNDAVHPAVLTEIDQRIEHLAAEQRIPYVIIEAALIYESGLHKNLDFVVVVDAPEEDRIRRVMARDGCRRADVVLRINSQMSAPNKVRRADFVVQNVGNPAILAEKVAFLDRLLCSI